jgi:hypothetical protein
VFMLMKNKRTSPQFDLFIDLLNAGSIVYLSPSDQVRLYCLLVTIWPNKIIWPNNIFFAVVGKQYDTRDEFSRGWIFRDKFSGDDIDFLDPFLYTGRGTFWFLVHVSLQGSLKWTLAPYGKDIIHSVLCLPNNSDKQFLDRSKRGKWLFSVKVFSVNFERSFCFTLRFASNPIWRPKNSKMAAKLSKM